MDQETASPVVFTPKPFLADLLARGACAEGRAWARDNKIKSPAEAWAKLERPDWMFWLAESYRIGLHAPALVQLAATWADRALHVHAPSALRSAGLSEQAAKLEALPPLAGKASSELTAAAWDAGDAAWDAAWAAARAAGAAAWDAGDAARAAGDAAGAAARAAAWDAGDAAWDAGAAAWAAEAAARAAGAAAGAAESECQCRELRAVGPSLTW